MNLSRRSLLRSLAVGAALAAIRFYPATAEVRAEEDETYNFKVQTIRVNVKMDVVEWVSDRDCFDTRVYLVDTRRIGCVYN